MKSTFFSILLLMSFTVIGFPINGVHESKFKMLDQADSKNKAAFCIKLLQNIKKDTFAAARLQEQMDTAALRQSSVIPADRDHLKKLKDLLLFENNQYDQHCNE